MITIKREKNDRGIKLGTLRRGDTFLYDNRVGVIVERNGHQFPIDLTTCENFHKAGVGKWTQGPELTPEDIVLPVEVALTFKVVG